MTERVLFVTPELHPLNKEGGLGDVSNSLVRALNAAGTDARLLMPGFPAVKRALRDSRPVLPLVDDRGREGCLSFGAFGDTGLGGYVVDFPAHFDNLRSPYGQAHQESRDEAARFLELARAAVKIATGQLDWTPTVVHCNDWTTGLVPVLLDDVAERPATVFTIHNLAYQGLFPYETLHALGLSESLWSHEYLEFHGQLSFIKGGLVFADRLNTVSPTYAREITTPEFGCGLDGLLRHRQAVLSGILNGVDYEVWHPVRDPSIAARYSADDPGGKRRCKEALQRRLGLELRADAPLFGVVSRLTEQKGIDLLLEAIPAIIATGAQLAVLGSGDARLEEALRAVRTANPECVGLQIGYDEALAHQIIAGADCFLMPSRFEPCGLTQLYSLAYGTIPVVHATGGLADTVVDADVAGPAGGRATGISYAADSAVGLVEAIRRAVALYGGPHWEALQRQAMRQEFSWEKSAAVYQALYLDARTGRR